MKDEALKSRIFNYLSAWKTKDPNRWLAKSHLEDLAREAGFLGDNAGRRLRELVEDGFVEHRPYGRSQEYRSNF